MSLITPVGIDVSAKELTVAIAQPGGSPLIRTFANETSGHTKLIRLLTQQKRPCRVCLEATGVYNIDLSLALHSASRIEVMVANPRTVHNFAKAMMARGKDDPIDAIVQCEFAKRMPFMEWVPPSTASMRLRTLARRLGALTKTGTMEKNRLHAVQSSREFHDVIEDDLVDHIEQLQSRHEKITQLALEHIALDPKLQRNYELLNSIKGIGNKSAILILAELCVLPKDMDKRQWVAHAGLNPIPFLSGTSVRGNAHISKEGNSYLRRALYMPAMVAARSEPSVKAYYDHLAAKGKQPMVILVAIMRKLLYAISGMLRQDTPFDGSLFFRQTE